jgi:hypothetical protein
VAEMIGGTLALGVIDRLAKLIQSREAARRRLFQDHIEPLFLDMTAIHSEYRTVFEELSERFRENPHSPEFIEDVVQKKKPALEHLRIKVHSLAKVFSEAEIRHFPQEAHDFFQCCLDYFATASGQFKDYYGHYSDLLDFIREDAFTTKQAGKYKTISMVYKYRTETGKLVGDDLGYKIWTVLQDINERWGDLTAAYAVCRAKLLT